MCALMFRLLSQFCQFLENCNFLFLDFIMQSFDYAKQVCNLASCASFILSMTKEVFFIAFSPLEWYFPFCQTSTNL